MNKAEKIQQALKDQGQLLPIEVIDMVLQESFKIESSENPYVMVTETSVLGRLEVWRHDSFEEMNITASGVPVQNG